MALPLCNRRAATRENKVSNSRLLWNSGIDPNFRKSVDKMRTDIRGWSDLFLKKNQWNKRSDTVVVKMWILDGGVYLGQWMTTGSRVALRTTTYLCMWKGNKKRLAWLVLVMYRI